MMPFPSPRRGNTPSVSPTSISAPFNVVHGGAPVSRLRYNSTALRPTTAGHAGRSPTEHGFVLVESPTASDDGADRSRWSMPGSAYALRSPRSVTLPVLPPGVLAADSPSYISARSANSLISYSRPTRIQAVTLHYLNRLLDELLLLILTSARSLATDRIKTDGVLRVLGSTGSGALLAKNAVLEAELEMRSYVDGMRKEGNRVPLGLSATSRLDGTEGFPVKSAYEAVSVMQRQPGALRADRMLLPAAHSLPVLQHARLARGPLAAHALGHDHHVRRRPADRLDHAASVDLRDCAARVRG